MRLKSPGRGMKMNKKRKMAREGAVDAFACFGVIMIFQYFLDGIVPEIHYFEMLIGSAIIIAWVLGKLVEYDTH